MNRTSLALIGAALLVFAPGIFADLRAQSPKGPDSSESGTSDATGIVRQVRPGTRITVDCRRGPFTYRLGLEMHITGPDNHYLKISDVRPGDMVTVYWFYRDAYPTVARIVVLKRGGLAKK